MLLNLSVPEKSVVNGLSGVPLVVYIGICAFINIGTSEMCSQSCLYLTYGMYPDSCASKGCPDYITFGLLRGRSELVLRSGIAARNNYIY